MFDRPPLDAERTTEIEASLTPKERARADNIRSEIKLALARQYPSLPPILSDALTRDSIGDKALFLSIMGLDGGPKTPAEYDQIAREMVLADELAVNAVNIANETAVRAARDEALRALSPTRRMSMARAGTLDDYLDDTAKLAVQTDAAEARSRVDLADIQKR